MFFCFAEYVWPFGGEGGGIVRKGIVRAFEV